MAERNGFNSVMILWVLFGWGLCYVVGFFLNFSKFEFSFSPSVIKGCYMPAQMLKQSYLVEADPKKKDLR